MLRSRLTMLLMPLLLISACTKEEEAVKEPVEEAAPSPDGSDVEDVSLGEREDIPEGESDSVSRDEVFPTEDEVKPEEASKAVQNTQPVQANTAPATATGANELYYVKSAIVLVREQPNDTSKTLRTLNRGDRVTITAIQGDWANLQGGGFANTKDLSKNAVGGSRKDNGWKPKKGK